MLVQIDMYFEMLVNIVVVEVVEVVELYSRGSRVGVPEVVE